jgi:hypothetical protein
VSLIRSTRTDEWISRRHLSLRERPRRVRELEGLVSEKRGNGLAENLGFATLLISLS